MYRLIATLCFANLFSFTAYSVPVLDSPWKPVKIVNEVGADIMRDSESEKTIWVKPPRFGSVELGDHVATKHPNQLLCSALGSDLSSLIANRTTFSRDLKRITRLAREIHRLTNTLGSINSQVDAFIEGYRHPNVAYSAWAIADELITDKIKLLDATHRVDACRRDCKELYSYKFRLEESVKAAKKKLESYIELHLDLVEKLESFTNSIYQTEIGIYNKLKSKQLTRANLLKSEKRLFRSFAEKAVLPAGEQSVTYRFGWRKLIQLLSLANPGLEFKALPIRSLRLESKLIPSKIDDFYLSSLPVFVGFKDATTPLARAGSVDAESPYNTNALDFIRANFTFSLNGICPTINASYRKVVEDKILLDDSLRPLYSATVTYSYPVKMPSPIRAGFNAIEVLDSLKRRIGNTSLVTENIISSLIDEGDLASAVFIEGTTDPVVKQMLYRESVNRVLVAMATPLNRLDRKSGKEFREADSASVCGSYQCKLSGWDILTAERYDVARKTLVEQHSGQVSLSESGGNVVTFTGVSVFNSGDHL